MKTIRKFLSPLSFFLATLILFTSCEQYDNNLGTNLSEHNEVELFKSIIFADGEITNNFETLADSRKMIENFDSEQLTKYRETQTKVINYITENNPIFFTSFKDKITSNNASLVSEAINESVYQVKAYLKEEMKLKNLEINKNLIEHENDLDLSDYNDDIISGVGVWLFVTVVVVLFIVINTTIDTNKTSGVPTSAKGNSSFSHQSLVLEILNK